MDATGARIDLARVFSGELAVSRSSAQDADFMYGDSDHRGARPADEKVVSRFRVAVLITGTRRSRQDLKGKKVAAAPLSAPRAGDSARCGP
jgi:hypothetical protein